MEKLYEDFLWNDDFNDYEKCVKMIKWLEFTEMGKRFLLYSYQHILKG